ncbi:MAG: alpha/beta hydrolase [Clostridium argentinense]|uniref:Alpha/beta hydrolase n=1 Tax=Clostridium faecium TaxID=2762223 RepID=A0ABR8YQ87_9CLOT|nr:alpha/beta hydrolase [Clostridium faecium]MBD8046384.1 alpha/beta hydrolase [Clostridium faecium]MBS5825194.1 alpha/beta hydrolase [Clostridium argentinense]
MSGITRQIILIPGIMGSTLSQKQLTVWPKHISHIFDINFYDVLKDLDDNSISASSIISLVYNSLEKFLKTQCTEYTNFYYDWRQNNLFQPSILRGKINKNVDEVVIVAHSMGGIITKLFLNEYKNDPILLKIGKIVTLGTPFNGAPDAYKAILFGKSVPNELFPIILSKGESRKIIKYFPSIYQLLPNEDYCNYYASIDDYYLIKDDHCLSWKEIYNDIYKTLLKEVDLDVTLTFDKFYKALNSPLPPNITHHEIIGFNIPTLCNFIEKNGDYKGKFNDGDGTVPLYSALTNTSKKYFVKCDHGELTRSSIVHNILKKIFDNTEVQYGSKHKIYTFNDINSMDFKYKIVKIACPVVVYLKDKKGNTLYGSGENLQLDKLNIYSYNNKVQSIGDSIYFIVEDEDNSESFVIEGYDRGAVTISIDEYENGKLKKTGVFKSFNIDKGIKADLIISSIIDKFQLFINNGIEKIKQKLYILDSSTNKNNINLPKTKYSIIGEKINASDEGYLYGTGKVDLKIDNLEEGSYGVVQTWCSVNKNKPILIDNDNLTDLELKPGINNIIVYSKDALGNTEPIEEKTFYYLDIKDIKVKLKFNSLSYYVSVELNNKNLYKEIELIDLSLVENHTLTRITYDFIKRPMEIRVKDAFDIERRLNFTIDEDAIEKIIKSHKDSYKYIDSFMKGLQATDYKIYKKEEDSLVELKSSKEINIRNNTSLFILSDIFEVEILKEELLKVVFSNLYEEIDLNSSNSYSFTYKIFNNSSKEMLLCPNLKCYIGIKNENNAFKELYKLATNSNEDFTYTSNLIPKDLKSSLLNKNIFSEEFNRFFLIIQGKINGIKILRIHNIVFRY